MCFRYKLWNTTTNSDSRSKLAFTDDSASSHLQHCRPLPSRQMRVGWERWKRWNVTETLEAGVIAVIKLDLGTTIDIVHLITFLYANSWANLPPSAHSQIQYLPSAPFWRTIQPSLKALFICFLFLLTNATFLQKAHERLLCSSL